ncbi:8350_t:CDS:1, partial [Paraglomus occultum]
AIGRHNRMVVILGTSGCGKTRTCFELLSLKWGLYFLVEPGDIIGSRDLVCVIAYLQQKLTRDKSMNHTLALAVVRCALLSQLLILDYCCRETSFNPHCWLLLQTCQRLWGLSYHYGEDIFCTLTLQLIESCEDKDVQTAINTIYLKFCNDMFPIVLDEAQLLSTTLENQFSSRNKP